MKHKGLSHSTYEAFHQCDQEKEIIIITRPYLAEHSAGII